MILDACTEALPERIEADVCIVGAGPAGISMARRWLGTYVRVCLVEAGGLRPEPTGQAEREDTSVGQAGVDLLRSRVRALGGTSHVWGGGCIPLGGADFASRDWVPHSGWPLSFDQLRPHYLQACEVFGIDPHHLREGSFASGEDSACASLGNEDLQHLHFVRSPTYFGEVFGGQLARASNVQVLLHTHALCLDASSAADHVNTLTVRVPSGQTCTVAAKYFVLAGGGIENARLLLLSNTVAPNGLGNERDLVGRYFMEHPSCRLGILHTPSPESITRPYDRTGGKGARPCFPELCLSDRALRSYRLLNARVRPFAVEGPVPAGLQALRNFRRALREPSHDEAMAIHGPLASAQPTVSDVRPPLSLGAQAHALATVARHPTHVMRAWQRKRHGRYPVATERVDVVGYFEQAPNPDSRVRLGQELDAMGQRRLELDWRLTPLDWHTYRCAATLFGNALAKASQGQFQIAPWLSEARSEPAALYGTAHHMGTTRMARSPNEGVVDVQARVYGLDNVHIAGSSVFPTGGWAFPTFTLVAMALRLSDHLHAFL